MKRDGKVQEDGNSQKLAIRCHCEGGYCVRLSCWLCGRKDECRGMEGRRIRLSVAYCVRIVAS